jgi:transposase
MGRHRTPEEKVQLGEQARAMRAAGKSRREIEVSLGIGDDLAKELLRGTEVPDSLRRPRAKDELRALARDMYLGGRNYREIERELGVARSSLSLWLRDLKEVRRSTQVEPPIASSDSRVGLARELRAGGLLLKEIAEQLGVSTVCVHRWVRDLPVPKASRPGGDLEHMHRMRRAYWDPVLAEREAQRQAVMGRAAALVGELGEDVLDLLAVTAYWCEGTKSKAWRRQERVTFINSDPGLISLFLDFLRRNGVDDSQLRLGVSIHESADVGAAERYWGELIGIPVERFRPPQLKRHNPKTVRKNTGESYVGCLTIGVRQSRVLYQRNAGMWQGIMAAVADDAAA